MSASADTARLPRLSVVTASRGRHDTLLRKAAALTRQTLDPAVFEWCLYLNETPAEVRVLRDRLEPGTLPFRVHVAGGTVLPVGAARNRAVEAAGGAVLLLSDDDCLPDPGSLAAHLAFHERYSDAVGIGQLRLPEALRIGRQREPFERTARLGGGRALWINLTGANSSLPAEHYRAVGGYDPAWSGYGGEDPELALRLRARGLRFRHVPHGGATHEGRVSGDTAKAYDAGAAHVRVVRRHRHRDAAWLLGVHPWLLAAKRACLHGPLRGLLEPSTLAYERAYAAGAAEAWRRAAGDDDSDATVVSSQDVNAQEGPR